MGTCSSRTSSLDKTMGNNSSTTAHTASVSTVVAPATGDSGPIRRATPFADRLRDSFFPGEVQTCYDIFQRGLRVNGDGHCFGFRPVKEVKEVVKDGKTTKEAVFGDFEWYSYKQIAERIDNVGSAIVHFDLSPANDTGNHFIGIYGKNRWEWSTAQQALYTQNVSSVPLYDTLGAKAVSYILRQTSLTTIFCSKLETGKLLSFKKADAAAFASLVNVVQFEDVDAASVAAAAEAGITLRSFAQLEEAGKANRKAHVRPTPDDCAVVCYTSGTTGDPKGALLTHRVMVADACNAFWGNLGICATDVHLSYLPLAHVFEQLVENALVMVGAAIGFYSGDTLRIMEDIKALRPTVFPSVPRLFNRIFDKINGGVAEAGGVKAALFHQAFTAKQFWLKQNHVTHSVWDPLVFKPLITRMGLDRCRLMISGSAPLAPHVMEFLRVVFCVTVCEGYGQTEAGGASCVTDPADQASIGHVGGPLASNEIKLVSVPDLGYLVTDTVHGEERDKATRAVTKAGVPCEGRGEVCYRGPNIFPGYYKDPANTAAALDADGWLHSGDIGLWDARGHIRIIDRKKNMFKLSQGEYVAAEKVENEVLSQWVQQVFVYGDSLHSMLVAIVVPNPDTLRTWAAANHKAGDAAALVRDPELKALILKDMQAQGKRAGLMGFEVPKDIHLDAEPWTPENVLTPTFKLKRKEAKERYAAAIDEMYGRLETIGGKAGLKQGHE